MAGKTVRHGGKIKNSYIRGGCSDVGALTYYEKTTRSKIIIYQSFIHENYCAGNTAYGVAPFEARVVKTRRANAKKKPTPDVNRCRQNKHTMRKLPAS